MPVVDARQYADEQKGNNLEDAREMCRKLFGILVVRGPYRWRREKISKF
jgi:hypothetical protein